MIGTENVLDDMYCTREERRGWDKITPAKSSIP